MKEEIKKNFKKIINDRPMTIVVSTVFTFGIIFFIFMITKVQVFDRLIYSRYTSFGQQHFYKDNWTYRLFLAFFGLIVSFLHCAIIAKINSVSGRKMAIFFSIISVIVIIFAIAILSKSIVEIPN